jgi:hypothetical protein
VPDVKPEWVRALRAVDDKAELRFNHTVNRWEFRLSHADGVLRSQFWGDFSQPKDPVTGLHPYRALTDDTMREALANLEKTFVGNPYDGHGTVQRAVGRAYFFNKRLQEQRYRQRGQEIADYFWDHRRQIRDAGAGPLVTVAQEFR